MNHDTQAKQARRSWSAETKLHILKQGPGSSARLSTVCDQYDIQPPQFYRWERAGDPGALAVLRQQKRGRKRHTPTEEALLSETDNLRAVMAELIQWRRYRTREEARHDIVRYIEGFHNAMRRHSALGHRGHLEFEQPIP